MNQYKRVSCKYGGYTQCESKKNVCLIDCQSTSKNVDLYFYLSWSDSELTMNWICGHQKWQFLAVAQYLQNNLTVPPSNPDFLHPSCCEIAYNVIKSKALAKIEIYNTALTQTSLMFSYFRQKTQNSVQTLLVIYIKL